MTKIIVIIFTSGNLEIYSYFYCFFCIILIYLVTSSLFATIFFETLQVNCTKSQVEKMIISEIMGFKVKF